jgi:hypothetical protein
MIRGGRDLSLLGMEATRLACRPGGVRASGQILPLSGGPNLLSDEARVRSDVVEGHVVDPSRGVLADLNPTDARRGPKVLGLT